MPEPTELNPDAIKAVAHPTRQRIIALLYERDRSPKELAAALREPLPNVVHHMRVLEQLGAVEVSETIQHKGTIERRYRLREHLWVRSSEIEQLPPFVRDSLLAPIAAAISRDLAAATRAGKLGDRADASVVRVLLDLDERGWRDVHDALAEVLERVVRIRDETRARLAAEEAPAPPTRSEVAILHFELAPASADR